MFLIFMGVSGSGKTTLGKAVAERLGVPFFEGDDFHPRDNIEKMSNGIPLTDADREDWLDALERLIRNRLAQGGSGVLACSALKKKYRDQLQVDPRQVAFIYLEGSYEVIHERMKQRRDHYMDPKLLKSQFRDLEEPENAFTIAIEMDPDLIVDHILAYLSDRHESFPEEGKNEK